MFLPSTCCRKASETEGEKTMGKRRLEVQRGEWQTEKTEKGWACAKHRSKYFNSHSMGTARPFSWFTLLIGCHCSSLLSLSHTHTPAKPQLPDSTKKWKAINILWNDIKKGRAEAKVDYTHNPSLQIQSPHNKWISAKKIIDINCLTESIFQDYTFRLSKIHTSRDASRMFKSNPTEAKSYLSFFKTHTRTSHLSRMEQTRKSNIFSFIPVIWSRLTPSTQTLTGGLWRVSWWEKGFDQRSLNTE